MVKEYSSFTTVINCCVSNIFLSCSLEFNWTFYFFSMIKNTKIFITHKLENIIYIYIYTVCSLFRNKKINIFNIHVLCYLWNSTVILRPRYYFSINDSFINILQYCHIKCFKKWNPGYELGSRRSWYNTPSACLNSLNSLSRFAGRKWLKEKINSF